MEELLSLVLTVQPLELPAGRQEFPRWWGRAAQAALLALVEARNPALAAQLHLASVARPYTVSNLMGHFEPKSGAPALENTYWLRWTALSAELSGLLLDFAETAQASSLELDHIPFRVLAAAHKAETQPWAGSASYAALGARFLAGLGPARRVTFQFTSPVVFKSGGLSHPLPSASLVFHSLLERWNAFAPLTLGPEVQRFAEECLAVSRFELKSRPVALKDGGLRIGAVGALTFTATHPDKFWLGQIQTLAAFAQFAGVGAGTAQGLGQTRMLTAE
ncbi:MAG: CRISPR system precrRNA processing endoribonuclease RAMP protein Cas6 [Anaerolineales bacterium]|jgi:CRISPR-associated endoribonuclease Cas6|nr:CRISPR system precrRNA processing endoribonuclease RAMP protein Cas6 [Anaerolineales bacterium]